MTSGVRLTVRAICSIWARLKPVDVCGQPRPALQISRNGRSSDGMWTRRLVIAALPAHERSSCQVVCTVLEGRHDRPGATEVLLKVPVRGSGLCRVASQPRQQPAEAGQYDDGLLECRELIGRKRWVRGHVRADQGGEVRRVLHPAPRRPYVDGPPISALEADRDSV